MSELPTLSSLLLGLESLSRERSPIQKILAATKIQEYLEDLGERVMDSAVRDAQEQGRTWAEIGQALGITRQAAHHRYSTRPPIQLLDSEGELVLEEARTHAAALRHEFLGSAHFLLAMSSEPTNKAGKILRLVGLSTDRIKAEVIERGGGLSNSPIVVPPVGLSARASNLFMKAWVLANASGRSRINSIDIALASLETPGSLAASIIGDRSRELVDALRRVGAAARPEDDDRSRELVDALRRVGAAARPEDDAVRRRPVNRFLKRLHSKGDSKD